METSQSCGNFTVVHIDHTQSSHAVKVWIAASQQTDLSLSPVFQTTKSWWLGQKRPLTAPTQSARICFLKSLKFPFKYMTATLGWWTAFGSRPSTQLTAVTSCGVILCWRADVTDELWPFGYNRPWWGTFLTNVITCGKKEQRNKSQRTRRCESKYGDWTESSHLCFWPFAGWLRQWHPKVIKGPPQRNVELR